MNGTLLLVSTIILLTHGSPAHAQQTEKVWRIGFLGSAGKSAYVSRLEAFRGGMRELGYIEGKNIIIEYRYADGKFNRLPELADELVRLKVDLIYAPSTPTVQAAKTATKIIPIVTTTSADPVQSGLIASLARPGGNVTGLTSVVADLSGKRLELAKELLPQVKRVAVLRDPDYPTVLSSFKDAEIAAAALGLKLYPLDVRNPNDFDTVFGNRSGAHALIHFNHSVIVNARKKIVELANKYRLPAIYNGIEFVEAGGLMSYGPNSPDLYRRVALFVDKIFKGAKPADLPVEQPTKFELLINLKTAKQIGLTIPPNVLARADKVIR